ncbi:hypothetical protein B4096_3362 [Heyndrickxia coagulans]|uniref:Uncharacterized protein n=1 Tax=Heyndrickxia coagulans TaxID=1398 RepID=A0AAN0T7L0_HEYCO|nr:hypothetical protein SB48_HM08orf03601 [Heyndrickxia coagulans]KYC89871.1 hypothetical protein B4096_3362 [Heyndrickxia coagulans]
MWDTRHFSKERDSHALKTGIGLHNNIIKNHTFLFRCWEDVCLS